MITDGRAHQVTPRQPGEKPMKCCGGQLHNGQSLPVEAFGIRAKKDKRGLFYRNAYCFECGAAYARDRYHEKRTGAPRPTPAPVKPSAPVVAPPPHNELVRTEKGPGGVFAAGRRIVRAFMSKYWLALYDEHNVRHVEPAIPERVQQLRAAGVLAEGLDEVRVR